MPTCTAYGCTNDAPHELRLFHFPKEVKRRKEWEAKVKREN